MPLTIIANKATTQIKTGSGTLQAILISNAGTAWTLQINDGPNSTNGFTAMVGSTAFTVPAVGTNLIPVPLTFTNGLQVVTAGTTAGEMTFVWQ